jgi:hypothetical protein
MYSISDLDVTKSCETGFEFEVTDDATGKGTGLFLTIIGGHAQKIADFTKKSLNERRLADAMAEKRDPRGKKPNVHPVEEDIEFSTELVAMRIIAWRGISDPYSHENAMRLCTVNPPIKEQVLAVSENLKNFPSPFSSPSVSTSANQPG